MLRFLLARLAAMIPILLVVAIIVFLILRLTPGDPASVIAGNNATLDDVERIREQLGLSQPLIQQFLIWISSVLSGDMGYSFYMNQSVVSLIAQRIEPTLSLAVLTMALTVLVAVPLGTAAAWRLGGKLDRAVSALCIGGFSIPVFVVGYVLIYALALNLGWFPVQGYTPLSGGVWHWLQRLVLPSLALSLVYIALITRVTRAAVSEALTEEHVRTARAKGLSERAVLWQHGVRNAAVPIVTVLGLSVAALLGGVVITETVFAIPGLGSLTVDAVVNRDFPVIQGVVLFFSVIYVLINLSVDFTYVLLDPRIRY
ncbi:MULTISPECIES: ABC transporter permease [Achromobacter]|uniref:ABC transporter permease n=1 Tax=Achromobacter sp. TaxID=134375 RepID=UPI002F956493